ncbi:adenylate/guanylate cyclase domain-containing protein [Bradyrhizobium sp.]|uniref:adenylate/guanylate cyclase domain-containing protein n=1 Tax=Bradyrhizobium sp. TaxID=376 RepID=UPI003C24A370
MPAIGINVGDIIFDGDDIFGDGVNVAARLEALADPGGIMVSGVAHDQVRDKLSFGFEDLGRAGLPE